MSSKDGKKKTDKPVAENRKARHDYFVDETFECGIVLVGTEVKSLRAGRVNLRDSYASVVNGEMLAHGVHISMYEQGNQFNHDPMRDKKLLLHKREIRRLFGLVQRDGYSLIPLAIVLRGSLMKMVLGLCKGKHTYDKREDTAKRDAKRDIEREIRARNR